jgi:type I restriction enzyme M protein
VTGRNAVSSAETSRLVRKLWSYCNILRDDGLSYPDYVEQLTYLLFLKMSDEISEGPVPLDVGWKSFASEHGQELHDRYSRSLAVLSRCDGMLGLIFGNARNKIRDPAKLQLLVIELIGQTQWTGLSGDVKGDAYEGLLEKNAKDTKSGAGQYFTPRALVNAIVQCVDPKPGEVICDPACGTGGFLLAAVRQVEKASKSPRQLEHLRTQAIRGVELVDEVARLATMNLMLHGIGGQNNNDLPISRADSLRSSPKTQVDVVLTNPPFGVRGSISYSADDRHASGGGELTLFRPDFWVETANKQLNFLQHVVSLLKPGGRAAVVVPDNVLYEDGQAAAVRRGLLETCEVHTLLRLPAGLFYAQGVKSNVLFFDRFKAPAKDAGKIWVFDLRSDMRFSLKTRPMQHEDLAEFIDVYMPASRVSRGEDPVRSRWRPFWLDDIRAKPSCSLDLKWSVPSSVAEEPAGSRLDEISRLIADDLRRALEHLERASGGR